MVHWAQRGIIKMVADRDTATLVGGTVVGRRAGDMLGVLNLAVHARIPMPELQSMMYGFPAPYSAIGEALGAYGRGVTTVMAPDYEGLQALDEVAAAAAS